MTYEELVDAIRSYTEVDENVFTDTIVNLFITLAENRILRDIDLDAFKREAYTTLLEGDRFLATPEEMLVQRYLMARVGDDEVLLDFRDQSFMKEFWPDVTETGVPKYYSIWDDGNIYVAPTPNDDYRVQLGYMARPLQISTDNPNTWLSIHAPEVLLFACLIQAYNYTKGPMEMIQLYEKSYQQAIQSLGIEQQGRRRRDEYRDGMIRLPVASESPGPVVKTGR